MTFATINRAANDPQLRARVDAAAYKEAVFNAELGGTEFGQLLLRGLANVQPLMWRVAVDTEAQYETALAAGRGAPGHDADIITDGQLTSAIVAGWPPDPEPPETPI